MRSSATGAPFLTAAHHRALACSSSGMAAVHAWAERSNCLRSLGYFRFYVVLGFVFLTAATAIGIFLPIWEARDLFFRVGVPASMCQSQLQDPLKLLLAQNLVGCG